MTDTYVALQIGIMAAATLLLRVIPFIIWREKETPPFINFVSRYLPYAIMGMLVVYCLKGISFAAAPFALPEIISVLLVALLHIWRRNTLISIVCGTACYMILLQLV